MNKKGFTLIESLLFYLMVILIVNYVCILSSIIDTKSYIENRDEIYEEAYK